MQGFPSSLSELSIWHSPAAILFIFHSPHIPPCFQWGKELLLLIFPIHVSIPHAQPLSFVSSHDQSMSLPFIFSIPLLLLKWYANTMDQQWWTTQKGERRAQYNQESFTQGNERYAGSTHLVPLGQVPYKNPVSFLLAFSGSNCRGNWSYS